MNKIWIPTLFWLLSGCDEPADTTARQPVSIVPEDAQDYFSHMAALENGGDKGQVLLNDGDKATLWFGTVKNLLGYLHLPETANRPMQAFVSIRGADGQSLMPRQWRAVENAWYVKQAESAVNIGEQPWQAFGSEADAQTAAGTTGKVYSYAQITTEVLGL